MAGAPSLNEPAPSPTVGLDWVVTGARVDAPLAERLEWVEHLFTWIRSRSSEAPPATRLKFLLQVLERNPEHRRAVGITLRKTFGELSALVLLCETGLPRANAFLQEFGARLAAKVLPAPPAAADYATLFRRVFPDESDADWIGSLPEAQLDGLGDLLREGVEAADSDPWAGLRRDAEDALMVLASFVQAVGMSGRVRRRVATVRPIDTPFAGLTRAVHDFIQAAPNTEELETTRAALESHIARCRSALADAMGHLESYGVSTDLVFMLERGRLALKRMEPLVDFRANIGADRVAIARFIARLVSANAAQNSLGTLLRENGRLLARRVVESARRTGEHYLTHDRAEYSAMLWSAAIGGAVTGLTVLVKFALTGHGLPPFIEGVLAATNYAVSFVAIHFLHGTLATKQPAMTAAAIAAKLNAARHRRRLREFVDEVASLVRSQMAAIAGNLTIVVPSALLLQGVLLFAGAGHLPDGQHAQKSVEGLSILGPSIFFAAFTGVLLWLSAVFAGWFENWATYQRLPEAIASAPRLVEHFGAERAQAIAGGIERNVAALGGNIALGILLGMTPQIAGFFGLPLDVRHVTLSTGQLALASFSLGRDVVSTPAFWLAIAGIGVIGFMNLTVSFGLALWVAIRSTSAGFMSRRRLWRAVVGRLLSQPLDFLLPPRVVAGESPVPDTR